MKKIFISLIVLLSGAFIVLLFVFSTDKKNSADTDYRSAFCEDYKILTPPFPDSVSFAGEKAPLYLFYVREKFDEQLLRNTFFHSSTIGLIKRSLRWFPVIEPILKKQNIPVDFKYLVMIESGLKNVVSPKGATGFWQFLESTALEYDLEVNKDIDERYYVEKATFAACRYLRDSYEELGSWTLVAATYNAGKKRIKDAIERQGTNDFYKLYLNDETSNYIFRILAMKTIFENPIKYGFYIRKSDMYPVIPSKTIAVENTVHDLVGFAAQNGISYKLLKLFNPWLRSDKLPDELHKTYFVTIPDTAFINSEYERRYEDAGSELFNDTLTVSDI